LPVGIVCHVRAAQRRECIEPRQKRGSEGILRGQAMNTMLFRRCFRKIQETRSEPRLLPHVEATETVTS
jgi:hypothetical protein